VRRYLRVAAMMLGVSSVALWLTLGANRGWTKTTRTEMKKDPVTDIDYPVVEKRFSPGVELLGAVLLISVALAGVSFAFKPKPKH
jgi:hypothetical protein